MIVKAIATGKSLSPFALLLNPAFWLCIIAWTVFTAYFARDYGAEQERFKQQALTIQALEAQEKAAAKVLADERQLRTDDRNEFIKFKEKDDHAHQISDQLLSDIRRDNRRLRVPVRRQVCPAQDGSGPAAAGTGEEGYAELTVDFSEEIIGFLTRGDDAIRKHAEVVGRYERLRQACMQQAALFTHPQEETP